MDRGGSCSVLLDSVPGRSGDVGLILDWDMGDLQDIVQSAGVADEHDVPAGQDCRAQISEDRWRPARWTAEP